MRSPILLDTGPLVALLHRREQWHSWVLEQWATIEPPLFTCEAVIAESCFLLSRVHGGEAAVLNLIQRKAVQIDFSLNAEAEAIQNLMAGYASVPMSLADACLVRMAELHRDSSILTLDSDFQIYRKHRNEMISVISPTS